MRWNKIKFAIFTLFLTITVALSEPVIIHYDSLARVSVGGPATVPVLSVIKNMEQLKDYCSDLRYEADSLHSLPDFSDKMILGFRTITGGGDRVKYKIPSQIFDTGDTIILEYKSDSTVYPGMHIAAAFGVILILIPKTDKSVTCREMLTTASCIFQYNTPVNRKTHQVSSFCYNLHGQLIPISRKTSGLVISKGKNTILLVRSRKHESQ